VSGALVTAGVLAACLGAKNATGQWFGTFHILPEGGGPRDDVAVVILNQRGDEITGSVGPSKANQFPLKKGKISGKIIRVEMESNRIVFVLTLDGDHLNGEIDDADEPTKVLGRVELARQR